MNRKLILAILMLAAALTIVLVQRHFRLKADALEVVEVRLDTAVPETADEEPSSVYTKKSPSPDGTGKVYLGREISQVMGHRGIDWLERGNREYEENPQAAIDAMDISPRDVIADVGAGSGYYTFRLAEKVPDGRVIAIDIQPEMLAYLENEKVKRGLTNVEEHLGQIDTIMMPAETLDSALFVDSYHEFSHPFEMMTSVVQALRPGGRVYLLEYRGEDPNVPIKPLHKMTEEQAVKEMQHVGLRHLDTRRHLPWQHFMVFEKP